MKSNLRLEIQILNLEFDLKSKLNVVDKCSHQFEPHGATFVYLLAESHLTLHSFVDEGKVSIDLFTCNLGTEFDKIKQIICDYFGIHALNINSYHFTRGD